MVALKSRGNGDVEIRQGFWDRSDYSWASPVQLPCVKITGKGKAPPGRLNLGPPIRNIFPNKVVDYKGSSKPLYLKKNSEGAGVVAQW